MAVNQDPSKDLEIIRAETERLKAEKALRETKSQGAQMLDSILRFLGENMIFLYFLALVVIAGVLALLGVRLDGLL